MANGQGSSLVPGTRTRGYTDKDHLNEHGALYLAPYICAAFDGWGFFAPPPRNSTATTTRAWRNGYSFRPREALDTWCRRVATEYCIRSDHSFGLLPQDVFDTFESIATAVAPPIWDALRRWTSVIITCITGLEAEH
eukprot:4776617-Prymnesium_polylepis.1